MTEYMVEIKNVTKEFRVYKKNVQRLLHELLGLNQGKVLAALSDINLTAAKGECILLMGSTGAGRTPWSVSMRRRTGWRSGSGRRDSVSPEGS